MKTLARNAATPLKIYSMSLTPADGAVLASLAQEATDRIGRSISASAVLRGILRLSTRGGLDIAALVTEIEREIKAGRKWGTDARRLHGKEKRRLRKSSDVAKGSPMT